ncbi:MAG: translation initiation factor IF-2 [Patescibacteria group bacterium]
MDTETLIGGRPPIVTVVGHIDHGKSTLLDYIRKTNVVAGEAGGITQHLSAYQATHKNQGGEHLITFLDTPGHAAFAAMRSRGLRVADVAILVVSSEEGVKPQTLEALGLIQEAKIPYVVAFTKMDKPGANLERAKMSLLEHQVFLEGMGGEIPWVAVSSKTGVGVPELLDLILLAAELEGISADASASGRGLVIEAHVDPKRGSTATLIVQDGTLESGEYVVAGSSVAPVRIMENFLGKPIKKAPPGSPIRIVGFSVLPQVGDEWRAVETKREAEGEIAATLRNVRTSDVPGTSDVPEDLVVLPLVIKTDVAGTGEAVLHELALLGKFEKLEVRVVSRAVGAITEGDVRTAGSGKTPGIIIGFNVKFEAPARDLAERLGVTVETFDIIYKLAEWLGAEVEKRRPRDRVEEVLGAAKVLKFFSNVKGRVVMGGRVEEGALNENAEIKIMRRDLELGRGKIVSLQTQKTPVKKVEQGQEFGAQLKLDVEPAPGDRLESFEVKFR